MGVAFSLKGFYFLTKKSRIAIDLKIQKIHNLGYKKLPTEKFLDRELCDLLNN